MKNVNCLIFYVLFQSFFTILPEEFSSIFKEAYNGDKNAIQERLENGENCAIKDAHGNTVLHIAAQQGHKEIVSMISEYYDNCGWWNYLISGPILPNLDDMNNNGDTALHSVIKGDSEYESQINHIEIADYLVRKKPELTEIFNKSNYSPAFLAAKKDAPEFIRVLAHVLNLHKHRKDNGDTLIHYSIKESKPKAIHYCVTEASLINDENGEGKTPILLSIDKEDIATLELLKLQGVHLNTSTKRGSYPILYATSHNKYASVNYLLNNNISIEAADDEGNTLLFYASNESMLKFLLSKNANMEKKNNRGEDVFVHAVRTKNYLVMPYFAQQPSIDINVRNNGQTELIRAAINQDVKTIEALISVGADINIVDNDRENVLHKLAKNGSKEGAKVIFDYDKSLLMGSNKYGNTPLFTAVIHDQFGFAEWLIDCNVSLNHVNNVGNTIVHEAAKGKNSQFFVKLLNKADQTLINYKNNDGETPLFEAVRKDDSAAINELIRRKADLTIKNNNNYSLMQLAAVSDTAEAMKALKACGVPFHYCGIEGNTLFHVAAYHGASKIIRYLQLMNEPFHLRNNNGETPLMCAAREGRLESTKLLLQESDYINGDVCHLIKIAANNHNAAYEFLAQRHNERMGLAQKIFNFQAEIRSLIFSNQQSLASLSQQKPLHNIVYSSFLPQSSSVDGIYNMTELERTQLFNHYVDCKNNELNFKIVLSQEFLKIRIEQKRNTREQENQRIEREQERIRAEQYRIANEQECRRSDAYNNKIKNCERVNIKQATAHRFIKENKDLLKCGGDGLSYQQSNCAAMARLLSEEELYNLNPEEFAQWEGNIDQCIKQEFTLNKRLKSKPVAASSAPSAMIFVSKEEVDEAFMSNLRKLEIQIKKEIENSNDTQENKENKQGILKKIINRIKIECRGEINNLSSNLDINADQETISAWTNIEALRVKIKAQMKKKGR